MRQLQLVAGKVLNEWERLVCVAMFVGLATVGYMGYERLNAGIDTGPRGSSGSHRGQLFGGNAWSFLGNNPRRPDYPRAHIFRVVAPPGTPYLPKKPDPPPEDVVATTPPENGGLTLRPFDIGATDETKDPNSDLPEFPVPEDVVIVPEPPETVVTPPRPPPKVRDELTFKGTMTSPSGEELAYMKHETFTGQKRTGSSTAFVEVGGQVNGLTVKELKANVVSLEDGDGKVVRVKLNGKRVLRRAGGDSPRNRGND